jgi:chromosome segregation ATPase
MFGVHHFMNDLKSEFKKLESLLNDLIAEQQLLRKTNQKLQLQLTDVEQNYQAQSAELQKLQTELNNAKLATGLNAGGDEAELTKAKLGSLMREIDRCIASLNE